MITLQNIIMAAAMKPHNLATIFPRRHSTCVNLRMEPLLLLLLSRTSIATAQPKDRYLHLPALIERCVGSGNGVVCRLG